MTEAIMGGTELMVQRLKNSMPPELLSNFQIIPTRLTEELDETKIRIAYIHDLAEDPQLNYLANKGWSKFHLIVFVSNWQMQSFIQKYQIPWSKCVVLQNAIEPIDTSVEKPTDKIKLIYTPTPHRGLNILVPVFLELLKKHPDIELDVFSSFKLYGWEDRDKPFENLFRICQEHPQINYFASQPNSTVRAALAQADIFVYPSIWQETSCLCLMEAMSAGLLCVHSNLGALYETAANWTYMYQFQEDLNQHSLLFMNTVDAAINQFKNDSNVALRMKQQKYYADGMYNWEVRQKQWQNILEQLVNMPRAFEKPNNQIAFSYNR